MNIENTQSQMRKGILEFCILSIIRRGEAYPSDIVEEMRNANLQIIFKHVLVCWVYHHILQVPGGQPGKADGGVYRHAADLGSQHQDIVIRIIALDLVEGETDGRALLRSQPVHIQSRAKLLRYGRQLAGITHKDDLVVAGSMKEIGE